METPILLSRSGATQMALELLHNMGITPIARTKGKKAMVPMDGQSLVFDTT